MSTKLTKASEGYLKAKRQLVGLIDSRMTNILSEIEECEEDGVSSDTLELIYHELDTLRNYIRNVMLWDTRDGE